MKFRVEQKKLNEALAMVTKAINPRNVLPVLEGVLIRGDSGNLTLTGTDTTIGIQTTIQANIIENGAFVFPAKRFAELVRHLPDEEVEVSVNNGTATVSWGKSQFRFHGHEADKYPVMEIPNEEPNLKVKKSELKNLIRQTSFAVRKSDDNTPVITGVNVNIENGKISLTGTDRFRVAIAEGSYQAKSQVKDNFTIPAKLVSELGRMLFADDEDVEIWLGNSRIYFNLGDTKVVVSTLNGEYPNIQLMLNVDYKTTVTIPSAVLTGVCERASMLGQGEGFGVKFTVNPNSGIVTVNASESGVGEIHEEIAAKIEGEMLQLGLNPQLILDGLKLMESEEVQFKLSGDRSVAQLQSKDDPSFGYWLMPTILT